MDDLRWEWVDSYQLSVPLVSGLPADLRRSGVDPGGVHAGGAREPSGLGDVRLRLLLRHDFHLVGGVRLRGASQQRQLGGSSESCSCLSDSCGLCVCTGVQVYRCVTCSSSKPVYLFDVFYILALFVAVKQTFPSALDSLNHTTSVFLRRSRI